MEEDDCEVYKWVSERYWALRTYWVTILQSEESGEGEKTFVFLRRHHASIVNSSSGLGREFSCLYMVKLGPQITVFYVYREHDLGIINLLSLLGSMWGSYHHCFVVWGYVLCF